MIGNQQITLQPGQFIFGRRKASKEIGLSERQTRTCIDSLKTMENLTIKTTNKFSVVTVVNWASYQVSEDKTTRKTTSNRPATCHKQECNNGRKNNILGYFSPESDPCKLSIMLLESILSNNPNSRLHHCANGNREKTIQGWAADIDRLIRTDKQEPKLIERVIKFATTDPFWKPNILSGRKLREKWDTLVIKLQPGSDKQKQEENSLGDRYRTL